ncbi:YcaO-like family protein [Inquilinus limosus]|uniref:YcaO-like family protein n=1 Tax=Inquilinus limosus TaxID=171674 RepID=UPI003F184878
MQDTDKHARLFSAAADILSGRRPPEAEMAAPARQLLLGLGFASEAGEALEPHRETVPNAVALLDAAAHLSALFRLPAPDAPGLVFVGGEADPRRLGLIAGEDTIASLAGAALDHGRAFAACVGEGVEYLSQFIRPGDHLTPGKALDAGGLPEAEAQQVFAAWLGLPDAAALRQRSWTPGRRLDGGEAVWLPAELVFRGLAGTARIALGTGCSAGVSHARATTAALLEVIERDAVALWWRGGQPGRRLDTGMLRCLGALDLISTLRGTAAGRETMLLDISTDLGVPCVAALSFTTAGDGFAAGFAAGVDLRRAARSALIELCQMELGLHLVVAKRRHRGEGALNDADQRQLDRASGVRLNELPILETAPDRELPPFTGSDQEMLDTLVGRLAQAGHRAYAADLGRAEFGIAVARALVPSLQPFPAGPVSPRLYRAMEKNWRNPPWERGIDLF